MLTVVAVMHQIAKGEPETGQGADGKKVTVQLGAYACARVGAGVSPWRRMISAILARSGGPPNAALITSADSRKYSGPIAAGVITQSAFASWLPLLSKR